MAEVVVPEAGHAAGPARPAPLVAEAVSVERETGRGAEHQLARPGREPTQVVGQSVKEERSERDGPVAAVGLRRAENGLSVTASVREGPPVATLRRKDLPQAPADLECRWTAARWYGDGNTDPKVDELRVLMKAIADRPIAERCAQVDAFFDAWPGTFDGKTMRECYESWVAYLCREREYPYDMGKRLALVAPRPAIRPRGRRRRELSCA